ncbi:MAG: MBL fold metallo-hydrolase [Pseudomonadales bacterium]
MIFRQLYDLTSSTYTYLLGCEESKAAVIIDAAFREFDRDAALIRELGLDLKYVLDTHVHADHVTSAWLMKSAFGAKIVLSASYDAEGVDVHVSDGDTLTFGNESLEALATPGHTVGCMTYLAADQRMAFTGDCLMIRGAGRTDFQSGDVNLMWDSIHTKLFSLPDDCIIYPGHDYHGRTTSTIAEERAFNPRIGGNARKEDFVGYMRNLGLPHPKLLDEAVPANLRSGRPDPDAKVTVGWGPVVRTFAGVPEIDPEWVAGNLDQLFLLDVRTDEEFTGQSGRIAGSHLLPLDELRHRLNEVPRDKPVITICQTGRRSALATQIMIAEGYERVANLPGGIVDWARMSLPLTD